MNKQNILLHIFQESFSKHLSEQSILLYCGHGSGSRYFPISSLERQNVRAVALLFGCSSAALEQPGVVSDPTGVAFGYISSGCPGVLGFLTPVSDREADFLTMELLKIWLDPPESGKQRMNLCSAVVKAREAAKFFQSSAGFVMYGLPNIDVVDAATFVKTE